jgi:hypothetical protein
MGGAVSLTEQNGAQGYATRAISSFYHRLQSLYMVSIHVTSKRNLPFTLFIFKLNYAIALARSNINSLR